jgi:hypothetical protein
MAISINITLEEQNRETPPWVDNPWQDGYVPEIDFEEQNRETLPWADGLWQDGYVPEIEFEAQNREPPPWVSFATPVSFPEDSAPDPISTPFVIEAELNPAPSAVDVPTGTSIFIPCGDAISTLEVPAVEVPWVPSTKTPTPLGLNPLLTTIWVSTNGGTPVVAFSGGSPSSGWSATVDETNQAGPNRGIDGVGRDYFIRPDAGWTPGASIEITVELVDYLNNDFTYTYNFFTKNVSPARISSIFVVQEFLLRLDFTYELAITPELLDPANYSLVPTRPVGAVEVVEVLPPDGETTTKVFLKVNGLKLDQYYSVSIEGGYIKDREGRALSDLQYTWRMRRTKMDVTVAALPTLYDVRKRTTIGGILEAIMISDEEIGGDY